MHFVSLTDKKADHVRLFIFSLLSLFLSGAALAGESSSSETAEPLPGRVRLEQAGWISEGLVLGDPARLIVSRSLREGPCRTAAAGEDLAPNRILSVKICRQEPCWGMGVVELEHPTSAAPLQFSQRPILAGSLVTLRQWQEGRRAPIQVLVQACSGPVFYLPVGMGEVGEPALDEDGAVVCVVVNRLCVRPEEILQKAKPREEGEEAEAPPPLVRPAFSFALGGAWGGWVESGHGAFILSLGAGATFNWVTLLGRFSFLFHSGVQTLRVTDPVDSARGTFTADPYEARLELECRMRIPLVKDDTLRLEPALGIMVDWLFFTASGPAMFSGEAGCDPYRDACPMVVRDPDGYLDDVRRFGWGMQLGLDLVSGKTAIGYRFIPALAAADIGNAHLVVYGISF